MSDLRIPGRIKSMVTDLETKSVNGERRISGYASRPTVDRVREVVDVVAFKATLDIFKQNPVMLWMHDSGTPIGTWDTVELRDDGLFVSGVLAKGVTAADEAWGLIKQGVVKSLSIGFRELTGEFDVNEVWHITQLELYEVSVVSIPANREAMFTMGGGKLLGIELMEDSPVREPADGVKKSAPDAEGAAEEPLALEEKADDSVVGDAPATEPAAQQIVPGWKTGTCAGCAAEEVSVMPFAIVNGVEWKLCPKCFCPPGTFADSPSAETPTEEKTTPAADDLRLATLAQTVDTLQAALDELQTQTLAQDAKLASVEKALLGLVRMEARRVAARAGVVTNL